MVKVANKWFAAKKIPNVKFFDVKDADDELEWLVQIGQQGMAEGNRKSEPPEADYGADYQDMVLRLKKLAGAGPLKTVYDPQKRVYKNMPTAIQPKKEQR
jgi:hypothetical protein